jgi:thiol:disulfide interchange protein DsbA
MRSLMPLLILLLATAMPVQAQQPAALPGLAAGVQYTPIEAGKPFQPQLPGKIEVVEVFAYWCPHCAHMQPKSETWKSTLPKSVNMVLMPAAFSPDDPFMLGYFAADAAKAVPATHARMFEAIHETGELARNSTLQQVSSFYLHLPGVNAKAFDAALADKVGMGRKMLAAREFQMRSKIPGTPSIIVDGRYLVLGNSYDNLLANARLVIDAISASRKSVGKAPTPPRS